MGLTVSLPRRQPISAVVREQPWSKQIELIDCRLARTKERIPRTAAVEFRDHVTAMLAEIDAHLRHVETIRDAMWLASDSRQQFRASEHRGEIRAYLRVARDQMHQARDRTWDEDLALSDLLNAAAYTGHAVKSLRGMWTQVQP